MNDHQVAGIKTYLANMSLHASPEWVEGCVEFFVSEHRNQGYSIAALKDFVLEQWKLADLREMGQGCLPLNLNVIMMTILPGKYALQVERIQNVGQSAYTQMQEIRKQVNENVEIGATLPQTWEPRPTRMLQLSLCDGVQNIKGIEYRPLMSLSEQLLPGCKVLIVGPVECRRGILLLEQHNLEILGGEIDSLLVPNAYENVLAGVLNLPQNLDPYGTQTDVSMKSQVTLPPVVPRNDFVHLPIQQNSAGTSQTQMLTAPIRNTVHRPSSRNNTNQISKGNPDRSVGTAHRRLEEELLNEDDLMLEAEMDAQLSVLEREYKEEMENSLNNLDIDEIEQKFLGDLQAECSEKMEFESLHYQRFPMQPETSPPSSESKLTANHTPSCLLNDDDDILLQVSLKELERPEIQTTLQRNKLTGSSLTTRQDYQTEPHMKALSVERRRIGLPVTPKSQAQSATTQSKITSFLNKSNIETADSYSLSNCGSNASEADKDAKLKCLKQCGVQLEYKQVPPNIDLNRTLDSYENLKVKLGKKHVQPEDYEIPVQAAVRKDVACTSPVVTSSNPFVYLSQIETPVEGRTVFTVKAFIMTLLSQMTYGRDGWHLIVKLCDGSKNIDARLSSDVLEKLIGFSRAEMLTMRQEMPNNPLLKEKLKNVSLYIINY
ncbi:hypothetical protein B7P43_G11460, partial [Cryptotermes secundus]